MKYSFLMITVFIVLNGHAMQNRRRAQQTIDCCKLMALAQEITRDCFLLGAYKIADCGWAAVEKPAQLMKNSAAHKQSEQLLAKKDN